MKRTILFALAFVFTIAIAAPAQNALVSGQVTSQATACPAASGQSTTACVVLAIAPSVAQISITIPSAPTFSATLQFEQSTDGGYTWTTLSSTPNGGGAAVTSTTAAGIWFANVGGATHARVRGSAYTSGVAQVTLNPSQAAAASTSSGSSTTNTAGLVPQTGLIGEYRMTECSGSTLIDSSGVAGNATFSGPLYVSNFGSVCLGGLTFVGSSNQQVLLPASLLAARTIILVTQFSPLNTYNIPTPICATAQNHSAGIMFRGGSSSGLTPGNGVPPMYGTNGGEFSVGSFAAGVNGFEATTVANAGGTNIIAWTLGSSGDATFDQIWVNDPLYEDIAVQPPLQANASFNSTHQSFNTFNGTGQYALGGTAINQCANVATWFTGNIYYAAFWNTVLTPIQLNQAFQAISAQIQQRGVQISPSNFGQYSSSANFTLNAQANNYVSIGDSITYGNTNTTAWQQYIAFPSNGQTWDWVSLGLSGSTALTHSLTQYGVTGDWANPNAANNFATMWLGTNDLGTGATVNQAYSDLVAAFRNYRAHLAYAPSTKFCAIDMISRTTLDTSKNSLNALIRQGWPSFADCLIDAAADVNIGADGANASATFFNADGIHPITNAQANDIAPMAQRAIGRMYGNRDWTTATTYTTAALAATATTAGSEATNTVTLTFTATPANCLAGNQVIVAGTTPAGYTSASNSLTDGFQIITRTATTITYWDQTSGLGAITVQGTAICPQQQDADVYTVLAGSATTPSFLLEPCTGYTGQNLYFKNSNTTSPWTLTPWTSAQTIDGAASLAMPTASSGNNPVVILQAQLISASAAGCTWKRLQ